MRERIGRKISHQVDALPTNPLIRPVFGNRHLSHLWGVLSSTRGYIRGHHSNGVIILRQFSLAEPRKSRDISIPLGRCQMQMQPPGRWSGARSDGRSAASFAWSALHREASTPEASIKLLACHDKLLTDSKGLEGLMRGKGFWSGARKRVKKY